MDVGQLDADAQLHTNEEECTHIHIENTTIITVLKHTDSIPFGHTVEPLY